MSLDGYGLETIDPPAEPALSLADAKAHLLLDHTAADDYVRQLVEAAVNATQRAANRLWISQTVAVTFGGFPCPPCGSPLRDHALRVPIAPVRSVQGLTYADADGENQALTGLQSWLTHKPPLVLHAAGGSWPATRAGAIQAVTLTLVAGYGDEHSSVPDAAKQAIRLTLGYWFENRGDGRDPTQWTSSSVLADDMGLPIGAVRLLSLLRDTEYH